VSVQSFTCFVVVPVWSNAVVVLIVSLTAALDSLRFISPQLSGCLTAIFAAIAVAVSTEPVSAYQSHLRHSHVSTDC
jgi:hypothetical protein